MQRNQHHRNRTELTSLILEFTGSEKIYGETINLSETGLCSYMPVTERSSYNYKPLPTTFTKKPGCREPCLYFW